ncbi:site-specific integrase [Reyranella aquatilis]|uniref:Site-specific integrase n=1 Tax=Reyranella aquatilis TaxID=2035356 RepID=A0ABS8KUZ3_9HYPH|nr:site-specific integrase [Reyranella aquatilis]MCC8429896.1 site-specific integrase [Reyranella aquatilis]
MLHQQHFQTASLYTRAGTRKYLTPAERERFIAAAQAHPLRDVRLFCLTLAYTGCRISEALAITGTSIEAHDGFIALRSLKRRNRAIVFREVPVPLWLLAELAAFSREREVRETLWQISRSWAWALVKAVMREAEIPDGAHATPKGLRHGYGLHAIRSGVPITLVQRWLGHARLTTTAIYLQAMGDEEREIASRMWLS